MDALLILGGLLLILVGLVWLVMRAFGTSLLWGWGSLIPPLTLIYVVLHWRTARRAVGLSALGFIPLVVGLTLMASQDAARLEAILSLNWLKADAQAPAELDIRLHGELNGQPFLPQHAELIDGVLSLREGEDFFARREVKIRLPKGLKAPIRLDVLPSDDGELPEVEVSWLLPEQDLPEARRLSKGYTLHLDLQALPPNKLQGDFHLVLPPHFKTTLSGRLQLFSDRLRYHDGRLDNSFDSNETLGRVIEDYLQRRFNSRLVQLSALPQVSFPSKRATLQTEARINGQSQQLELVLVKGERGWQVEGDRYPALPSVGSAPVAAAPRSESPLPGAASAAASPDRREHFSLLRLQRNPQLYRGLSMRVVKSSGGLAEGRFVGLDEGGNILLSQQRGGTGQVNFSLRLDDILKVELLEP
ncbi:MFS transporter [Pseudomonas alcaligenes]|uniref:MFS transporter n=1 Tax=Aquipseudomonas alcaligenes TaxID=43263 RepID=A0ABR7S1M4_AQUAC|nr:MFS transporter [Pseudomonas alcaligenes]MBC9250859.1 MFS transporter [Pseudomonas alcaligenes]